MYFAKMWIFKKKIVCILFFFFVVDYVCAYYNCVQIRDLKLKFEKKRKTTQKKNLQNFIIVLMNKFNSSKEKRHLSQKNKNESIYHQDRNFNTDKRIPNCLWLFGRQFRHEPIKNELSSAPEVSVCFFGFNKVAARKSTRKITGKNLNAKLIKKETNLNLKHCFAKVQS